jgi:hypothetical protein
MAVQPRILECCLLIMTDFGESLGKRSWEDNDITWMRQRWSGSRRAVRKLQNIANIIRSAIPMEPYGLILVQLV